MPSSSPPRQPQASLQVLAADRRQAMGHAAGQLQRHLARLRALPAHGNRRLHADQLFLALLLAFFDPTCRSLRLIEDRGDFGGQLDLPRLARATTADALAAFDPACLQPIIDDLRERVVPQHLAQDDGDLAAIARRIIAADGTYLTTLADVAWALHHTKSNGRTQGQVRANVQLDVATWTPQVLTVSGDDGQSEPAAFAADLLGGVLYVVDRNFLDFAFIAAVLAKGSDLVLRVRANAPAVRVRANAPAVRVRATRAPSAADVEAGVVADERVELSGGGRRDDAPPGEFRRVTIVTTDRHGQPEQIRLLTNLVDADVVAARVIGAVYRQRWQIELFFKWLKTWARLDHLLSTSRRGITFQFYVAVIGVLMMYVQSGRRVSVYALAALGRLAHGQCTVAEAMAVIARRERERAQNRARQARRRARKKLA